MSNSDDMNDKNFVWRDNYSRNSNIKEDKFDSYENNTYEAANEVYRKQFPWYLKIAAGVFLFFIILFIIFIAAAICFALLAVHVNIYRFFSTLRVCLYGYISAAAHGEDTSHIASCLGSQAIILSTMSNLSKFWIFFGKLYTSK